MDFINQSREKKSHWKRNAVIGIITTLLLLVAGTVAVRMVYDNKLEPVSSSGESVLVTIPRGATSHEIAVLLEEKGVIQESWAFEWFIRNNGVRDALKAGTYALRPSFTMQQVVDILTKGQIATDLVTILPGQRLDQIRDSLINAGFKPEEVDAALEPSQYEDHPALVDKPVDADLEGYLYPESFQKTAETKPHEIVRASLDQLQELLTPRLRAGIVKQGLTVHEGVILASIVGQEGKTTEERNQIAQVFHKRLREGMPLGADATTRYAIKKPTGALTAEDLATDHPYNTRKHSGLPPGPISNFTATALEAVAFPAAGDYLYFVTGDDGVTRFSNTVDEHEALIAEHGVSGE